MTYQDLAWLDLSGDFDDAHTLAEVVELILCIEREPFLSASELRSKFPSGNQPTDSQMMFAFSEIADRSRQMRNLYPFKRDGRGVTFDSSAAWQLYSFLLLLSFKGTPIRTDREWPRSDLIFDDISSRSLRAKLGSNAQSLIFGSPPRGGRPSKFPDAVEWAAKAIGVELRTAVGKIPTVQKDGGVDVIAWAPFRDRRLGFPIVLMQNTIQVNYVKKPRDVDPHRWRDWIDFGSTPQVGFAIPFHVPANHIWWNEISSEVPYFFDRGRLLEQLGGQDPRRWQVWGKVVDFVNFEIRTLLERSEFGTSKLQPVNARKRKARR